MAARSKNWESVGKPTFERVTKTLSREFAEMEPCPGDRPFSDSRYRALRSELVGGTFRSDATWCSCHCEETGKTYRVNGKHTSIMFHRIFESENGVVEKAGKIYVSVGRYRAVTLQDMADLYSTFDSRLSSRNASDINAAFSSGEERLAGFPTKAINLSVSSLAWIKWGQEASKNRTISQAEKCHEMLQHVDDVVWLRDVAFPSERKGNDSRALQRAPVVSAMFATCFRNKEVATEFWMKVRDASTPDREAVDRILNRYLLTNCIDRGTGSRAKRPVSGDEMYAKCIHAWNAYREGRNTVQLKHYPDAALPKPRA